MTDNNQDFIQVLLEKIEKDDLPTNVFDVEGTDPLVLLGKMNEIIGQLENFQSSVSTSNSTANEALSKAEDAIDTSGQALSNANTALGTANQAIGTANTAIETANQSLETAQDAEDIAGQALSNSNTALNTANTAIDTANTALEQVTQGLGTKVYDNAGNLLNETTFEGSNGINVDMQEENSNNFVISINQTITNQIEQNKNNITQLNNDVSELGNELNQTASDITNLENQIATKSSIKTQTFTSISDLQTFILSFEDVTKIINLSLTPSMDIKPAIYSIHINSEGVDYSSMITRVLDSGNTYSNFSIETDTTITLHFSLSTYSCQLLMNSLRLTGSSANAFSSAGGYGDLYHFETTISDNIGTWIVTYYE